MQLPEPTLYTDGVRTYEVWPTDAFPPELLQFLNAASQLEAGQFLVSRHKGRLIALVDNPESFGLIPESASRFRLRGTVYGVPVRFGGGKVTVGGLSLTGAVFTPTITVGGGVVSPGAVTLAGTIISFGSNFPGGEVSRVESAEYDPPSDPDAYVTNLSQLGSAVGSLSAGAVIVLADGTYNVNDITLKAGMQLWAENLHGAVINGGGTRMWAFAAHNPSSPLEDVELHGLVIKDYLNTTTGHAPVGNTGAKGWVYEDLEVYGNSRAGISLGENSTVRRVYCHDNGETGIASSQRSAGCVVEDSVLEANGFAFGQNDWKTATGSTGGMKLLRNLDGSGDPLVVRNVVARDNNGPGFWIDYVRNIEVTFEGCDAHDNEGPGFFLEASRPGPILVDGCYVSGTKQWPGIYVSGSEVVTVQNCEVSGRGIMVSEDNTSDRKAREAYVLDNTVTNLVSGSHGAQSQSGANIFDPTKIVFAGNSYPGVSGSPFRWAGSNLSLAQWRSVHGGE